ncbi:MAG: redoxin domain-containing protein [Pirellulaceae bacterium]|nr:redoxin domain-containing protein [Pirellulaceae bacterium]
MPSWPFSILGILLFGIGSFNVATTVVAQTPTIKAALSLAPVQKGVNYEKVPTDGIADFQVVASEDSLGEGWAVQHKTGRVLRRFLDTNADQKVDLWCYYQHGIEIYRDIDANKNGKADEYRWFGTEGTRHGLDDDEDGTIDRWKELSAQELSAEVVDSLATADAGRFASLLLNEDDLVTLGLSKTRSKDLLEKISRAKNEFAPLARRQGNALKEARWLSFVASRPGTVAANGIDLTKDIVVYENVAAMVEQKQKHSMLVIGTMVKTEYGWRLMSLPESMEGDEAASTAGYFFQASLARPVGGGQTIENDHSVSEALIKAVEDLQRLDSLLVRATTKREREDLHKKRAETFVIIIDESTRPEDRTNWTRQYADTLASAWQADDFSGGEKHLKEMVEKLLDEKEKELASYVQFRLLSADYAKKLSTETVDYGSVQAEWEKSLDRYIKDYSNTTSAGEAILQLAVLFDLAGRQEEAVKRYKTLQKDYPGHELISKAEGALRRLESVGKVVPFSGTTLTGKSFDIKAFRGHTVAVYYWASWHEPCKEDFKTLAELAKRHKKDKFYVLGVNLDVTKEVATKSAREHRLAFESLYSEGGFESELATNLGIMTVPTLLIYNDKGELLQHRIHTSQLKNYLPTILK